MKYGQLQPRLRESGNPTVQNIGKYGCYLLSLFQLGGLALNDSDYEQVLVMLHDEYLRNGWIKQDCEIQDGTAILHDLTGHRYTVLKIEKPVFPAIGDAELERTQIIYQYRAYSGVGYHFKTAEVDTEVERERLLAGFRIYTRTA
jgi:hypothetical protein